MDAATAAGKEDGEQATWVNLDSWKLVERTSPALVLSSTLQPTTSMALGRCGTPATLSCPHITWTESSSRLIRRLRNRVRSNADNDVPDYDIAGCEWMVLWTAMLASIASTTSQCSHCVGQGNMERKRVVPEHSEALSESFGQAAALVVTRKHSRHNALWQPLRYTTTLQDTPSSALQMITSE